MIEKRDPPQARRDEMIRETGSDLSDAENVSDASLCQVNKNTKSTATPNSMGRGGRQDGRDFYLKKNPKTPQCQGKTSCGLSKQNLTPAAEPCTWQAGRPWRCCVWAAVGSFSRRKSDVRISRWVTERSADHFCCCSNGLPRPLGEDQDDFFAELGYL